MSAKRPPDASVLRVVRDGLALLEPAERRQAIWLVTATILAGALDMVALATAMPFIGLLVDPETLLRYPALERLRQAVGAPGYAQLVVAIGAFSLALIVASGVLNFLLQRRVNRFAAACQSRLAREIMGNLVAAPYAWFLTVNATSISHVFQRDVLLWARELVQKVLAVVRDLAMIVLPALLVIVATPLAGLAALAAIGVLVFAVLRLARPKIRWLVEFKQEADGRANLLAVQALAGVKDVKISGREHEFTHQFAKAYGSYTWAHANLTNWHQLPVSVILLAGQIGMFIVALVLWGLGNDRGELAAQLALLVLVTSRILPAANRLAGAATTFYGVLPAIRSIRRLVADVRAGAAAGEALPSPQEAQEPRTDWHRLVLDRVAYQYPGADRPAVRELSMTLEPRRAYGVVGPSGAGKSTLVDLVIGLLTPGQGEIRLDDTSLAGAGLRRWQRRVGYVPQAPFITDDTLAANVAFGVPAERMDRERLARALEGANLAELVASLPRGVDTPLGDRGVRLSGGQRQRIAIARALYDEADLLILDEATSALDTVSERAVQEAIERLRGRVATVAIAHRLSTVRNCDRIFVMDGGRLVAEGSWSELLAGSPVFRAMVDAAGGKEAA
ncbi:MAG: ABC transporter ATP-binding protein [Alphaproteobacteria bacterium]|nr:ABC transporter ATP-binding protein [Alphaproteobacteria bacterium]